MWIGRLANDDFKKHWTKLVEIVEKKKLYENIFLYLMKMDCPDYRLCWCALPLHVASSEGDLALVRIILNHFDEKSLIHFHHIITTNQRSILVFLPKQKK